MRILTYPLMVSLFAAAPLAAQDTSITILNRDCTVKVNGKRLAPADEKKACERMQTRMQAVEVQTRALEGQAMRLRSDLERRNLELSREMPARLREMDVAGRAMAGRLALTERALTNIAARPRIGITVDTRPRETDNIGAYVNSVTPGGPADKAGIRSGDLITKVAGKAVAGRGEESAGLRLIEMIGSLETGKSVEFALRRGKDDRTVKVTPAAEEAVLALEPSFPTDSIRSFTFSTPGIAVRPMMDSSMARIIRRNVDPMTTGSYQIALGNSMFFGSPLASLEMASLNAGLGSYFGTSDGVLIINTGEKQELGLLPGDVVTGVDGRKVTSPAQLMRILRTYEKGEEFKLQIMRQKKTETVSGKMP